MSAKWKEGDRIHSLIGIYTEHLYQEVKGCIGTECRQGVQARAEQQKLRPS